MEVEWSATLRARVRGGWALGISGPRLALPLVSSGAEAIPNLQPRLKVPALAAICHRRRALQLYAYA